MAEKINSRKVAEFLKAAKSVAVFGHVLPDSDCYGSMFGTKFALENIGKSVYVYSEKETPYYLEFLKNYGNLQIESEIKPADITLIFDASHLDRVEASDILKNYKKNGTPICTIDHHMPGDLSDFSDFIWQDQSFSSTSEMALEILKKMGIKVKKDAATLFLAGIEGDTGSFQHQNTTERSLEDAAYLMSRGARFQSVVENTFNSKKDLNVMKMYGLALERLVYNKKYKIVTTYLTLEDAKRFGLDGTSFSGVINFLNIIDGAKIIVLITEKDEENIKVSLRTRDKDVDVQKLAANFGGGGHVKASGFTVKGRISMKNGQVKII